MYNFEGYDKRESYKKYRIDTNTKKKSYKGIDFVELQIVGVENVNCIYDFTDCKIYKLTISVSNISVLNLKDCMVESIEIVDSKLSGLLSTGSTLGYINIVGGKIGGFNHTNSMVENIVVRDYSIVDTVTNIGCKWNKLTLIDGTIDKLIINRGFISSLNLFVGYMTKVYILESCILSASIDIHDLETLSIDNGIINKLMVNDGIKISNIKIKDSTVDGLNKLGLETLGGILLKGLGTNGVVYNKITGKVQNGAISYTKEDFISILEESKNVVGNEGYITIYDELINELRNM